MNMLLNPSTFFAAQQEVDQVVGKEKIQVKHLNQLKYIDAVLKETLRLTPTAPAFARGVRPENKEEHVTIGEDNYEIPRGVLAICLIGKIQKDPKVWGMMQMSSSPRGCCLRISKRYPRMPGR